MLELHSRICAQRCLTQPRTRCGLAHSTSSSTHKAGHDSCSSARLFYSSEPSAGLVVPHFSMIPPLVPCYRCLRRLFVATSSWRPLALLWPILTPLPSASLPSSASHSQSSYEQIKFVFLFICNTQPPSYYAGSEHGLKTFHLAPTKNCPQYNEVSLCHI